MNLGKIIRFYIFFAFVGFHSNISNATDFEVRKKFVQSCMSDVREALAAAFHNRLNDSDAQILYGDLWRLAGKVRINFPDPGHEFQRCHGYKVYGATFIPVAYASGGEIYLCDHYLSPLNSCAGLDGTLMHELVHVYYNHTAQIENECAAERIGLSAFNESNRSYERSYTSECEIDQDYRIPDNWK